jgi:DNA-binding PadR family transcriptional regulator
MLQQSKTEQWADVLPGSVYHALKKLAGEGLVVLQAMEQSGNRAKAIYAITSSGEEEFRHLLKEAWRVPLLHFPSSLYAALTFLGELPLEEVLQSLDEQIVTLEAELAMWNAGERIKSEVTALPDYLRTLFANGREHIEIDLRLLHHLREMLPFSLHLVMSPSQKEDTDE